MLDRDDDCVDADGDAGAVVEAVLASDLSTKALGLKRAQVGGTERLFWAKFSTSSEAVLIISYNWVFP